DFAALVKEASDDEATRDKGGDLGPFHSGVHEKEIDDAVFAAAEGDVVGPFETPRGFEILKVAKGPGEVARSFDDVRALVSRSLYARKADEALAAAVKKFQEAIASK